MCCAKKQYHRCSISSGKITAPWSFCFAVIFRDLILNKTRVIPTLLLNGSGLVKTTKFKNSVYIGDPINTVRIFNEKEVDELLFLDIGASKSNASPNFGLLEDIAGEAFMPMGYGGGLSTIDDVRRIFEIGFEKVVLNSSLFVKPDLVDEAVAIFGSQSIIAFFDVRKSLFGKYQLFSHGGQKKQSIFLEDMISDVVKRGVGEIVINSIDKDGGMSGYDLSLIQLVCDLVSIPVVASGGASSVNDFYTAVEYGASAVAAGSMFVFRGPHRAVLISYPSKSELFDLP